MGEADRELSAPAAGDRDVHAVGIDTRRHFGPFNGSSPALRFAICKTGHP